MFVFITDYKMMGMIHISRDNNIILSKDLPLLVFFLGVIKFK